MPKVSIVVRTQNEEKWIGSCLKAIYEQSFQDFEVVLVDDHSEDSTLKKASQFPVIVKHYEGDYLPGRSLNFGVQASKGEFVAFISGHCVPTSKDWLKNLLAPFEREGGTKVAGVYGRQEPLPYSSDRDKRDLLTIFGLDRKLQENDSFFHNANSVIRRSLWEDTPFDEQTTNIEDRIWAKAMLGKGFKIAYEPSASVFHWHGIHQDGEEERCRNVVRILESLDLVRSPEIDSSRLDDIHFTAVIPVRGKSRIVHGNQTLLEYAIQLAKNSRYIRDVYVSTDDPETVEIAKRAGAKAPFIRPSDLSQEYVALTKVLKYSLEQIEKAGTYPDYIVHMTETYPFRPAGILDRLISETVTQGVDSLVPVKAEYKTYFQKDKLAEFQVADAFVPRIYKDPIYISLLGFGTVVSARTIRSENLVAERSGIFSIEDPICSQEVYRSTKMEYFRDLITHFHTISPIARSPEQTL